MNERVPVTHRTRIAVVALLGVFAAGMFAPYGLIDSIRLAYAKGGSVCAASGCTQRVTAKIAYAPGVERGYCPEHFETAPSTLRQYALLFPIGAISLVVGLFLVPYLMDGYKILTGTTGGSSLSAMGRSVAARPNAAPEAPNRNPPSLEQFALMTAVGGIGTAVGFWFVVHYVC
jgi:hypothetical protein